MKSLWRVGPLLVVGLWCFASSATWADDCQLKQIVSLEFPSTTNGMPVAAATLEGQPIRLLLASGAQFNVIPRKDANRLGLGSSRLNDLEGVRFHDRLMVDLSESNRLEIAHVSFERSQFFITDRYLNSAFYDAVIGAQTLSNFDLDLNLSHSKLGLFSPDHCQGKVVYWDDGYLEEPISLDHFGQITFEIELDGKKLIALIDTGADFTILDKSSAEAILGISKSKLPPSQEVKPVSVDGGIVSAVGYPFQTLAIGGITIRNPSIYIGDLPTRQQTYRLGARYVDSNTKPNVILGVHELRLLHLYIAVKERKLYFTPAGKS